MVRHRATQCPMQADTCTQYTSPGTDYVAFQVLHNRQRSKHRQIIRQALAKTVARFSKKSLGSLQLLFH